MEKLSGRVSHLTASAADMEPPSQCASPGAHTPRLVSGLPPSRQTLSAQNMKNKWPFEMSDSWSLIQAHGVTNQLKKNPQN